MTEHIENLLNSRYGKQIFYQVFGLCPVCNQPKTSYHCGNEIVDKFIQNAQSKARNRQEVIEWIPYEKLSDIQYLDKGGSVPSLRLFGYLNNSSNIKKDFLNEWENYLNFVYSTRNNRSDSI
ncbi:unnamed protein product [Rhizophagus irregularis]|nr:unnamed protein product [Rhizophagus irregularis]